MTLNQTLLSWKLLQRRFRTLFTKRGEKSSTDKNGFLLPPNLNCEWRMSFSAWWFFLFVSHTFSSFFSPLEKWYFKCECVKTWKACWECATLILVVLAFNYSHYIGEMRTELNDLVLFVHGDRDAMTNEHGEIHQLLGKRLPRKL